MTDKPLHVQVAEALGWTQIEQCGDILAPWASGYHGLPPGHGFILGDKNQGRVKVPRFDLEWDATGPLMIRFRVGLFPMPQDRKMWVAQCNHREAIGLQPLVMACSLIVDLAATNALPKNGALTEQQRRVGEPGELEAAQAELHAALKAESTESGTPYDELLTAVSNVNGTRAIVRVDTCTRLPWLRNALQRLEERRRLRIHNASTYRPPL